MYGDWETFGGAEDARGSAIRLASKYRVSWSAACNQLRNLELVNAATHAELVGSPPSRAEHLELDAGVVEDLIPPVLSRAFSKAVVRAVRSAKITAERATEMLRGTLEAEELPQAETPPLEAFRGELSESF